MGLQNLSKKLIKRSRKIWQIKIRCLNETVDHSELPNNENLPNNTDNKCNFCGKSFPQAFNLKIHILKAHPPPSKLNTNLPSDDRNNLPSDEDLITPHKCDICSKQIKGRVLLKAHKLNCHEDLKKVYICDSCGASIDGGKVMLQVHKYRKHYDNPKNMKQIDQNNLTCPVCLKHFTQESELNVHIQRTHCDAREFACEHCPKQFKKLTDLRLHLYVHYPAPGMILFYNF